MIQTEIMATGDEIRSGALVDTNSAWLARRLESCGLSVRRHECVGDNLEDLVRVITEMSRRTEVGLITGGLGPTPDDLSAQAAAQALGVNLELRPEALDQIRAFFQTLGREMPESNRRQAMLPQGADLLPNPVGTAPGFCCRFNASRLYFLPGVPWEMRRMYTDCVQPDLCSRFQDRLKPTITRTLSTFGRTESGTADALQDFGHQFPDIDLGFRAHFPEIQVKLTVSGQNRDVHNVLDRATAWVRDRLGDSVFSCRQQHMAEVVQELLGKRFCTLAVAESCTGGLISHWLTEVAGSSDVFTLSAVTYANAAKERILGVKPQTLAEHGAVSEPVAREMAQGVRQAGGSDFGLATTGIAGPSGGSEDKPVGTLCIGLAGPTKITAQRLSFSFPSRNANKKMFAMSALDLLRRHLKDQQEKMRIQK
ncbi:MAG: competence/damage-inducible protein A [Desulfovermiculus sp.]